VINVPRHSCFLKASKRAKWMQKNERKFMGTVKISLSLMSEHIQHNVEVKRKMLNELRSVRKKNKQYPKHYKKEQ